MINFFFLKLSCYLKFFYSDKKYHQKIYKLKFKIEDRDEKT